MSWDSGDLDVEVVEDLDDEWQRRQYLQQIYESVERTRDLLVESSIRRGPASHRQTKSALFDTLRLCRPLLQGSASWSSQEIGTVEVVDSPESQRGPVELRERQINGLGEVFALEDGFRTYEATEAPGRTSVVEYEQTRKELPPHILRSAFDVLVGFLYEEDVLVAESGEAEAKATKPT